MTVKDHGIACRKLAENLLAVALGEASLAVNARVRRHADGARCRHDLETYQGIVGALPLLDNFNPGRREEEGALRRLRARVTELATHQLCFAVFATPYGRLLLARSPLGVAWVRRVTGHVTSQEVKNATGIDAVHDPSALEPLVEQLETYWSRRGTALDWPLDFRFVRSTFQRRVLHLTSRVPRGAVMSFEALARLTRRSHAASAVARALSRNPLPIAIPCHRVVGADGTLGQYATGGSQLKRRLLLAEGLPLVTSTADEDSFVDSRFTYARAPGDRSYCLPSCRSLSRLKPGSATLFATRDDAEAVGLRPCTTCRPDRNELHQPFPSPLMLRH